MHRELHSWLIPLSLFLVVPNCERLKWSKANRKWLFLAFFPSFFFVRCRKNRRLPCSGRSNRWFFFLFNANWFATLLLFSPYCRSEATEFEMNCAKVKKTEGSFFTSRCLLCLLAGGESPLSHSKARRFSSFLPETSHLHKLKAV